jgi:hypothetical protein
MKWIQSVPKTDKRFKPCPYWCLITEATHFYIEQNNHIKEALKRGYKVVQIQDETIFTKGAKV